MNIDEVRKTAFAMPLTSPAFPPGPYRFFNREFLIISYRTDREALVRVVPEPLEIDEPIVKFEFIRMPELDGFRRLLRVGAGHSSTLQRRKGPIYPRDVFERWTADLRRPRALGVSKKIRSAETSRCPRLAYRIARLWNRARRERRDGL